jgi:hypothetical protein
MMYFLFLLDEVDSLFLLDGVDFRFVLVGVDSLILLNGAVLNCSAYSPGEVLMSKSLRNDVRFPPRELVWSGLMYT